MRFTVKLTTPTGEVLTRDFDGEGVEEVRRRVISEGSYPLEINRSGSAFRRVKQIKADTLVLFNQEFLALLKAGIPIQSRFGGVLEVRDAKPRRFTAVINYTGTSLDPSEQYIRARMTSVNSVVKTGNGKILANFREMPAQARAIAGEMADSLKRAGVGGVYAMGNTSEPVCQIPVGVNRVGMVLLGGLNPVAAAADAGFDIENIGESGLVDFEQLISFSQL